MKFDPDAFAERAAIMEFDGGLSRFEAETLAASAQGVTRREAIHAERVGNFERGGNRGPAMAGQKRQNNLPGVQQRKAQEK